MHLKIPLLVSGQGKRDTPFQEQTHTLIVSASGALISLAATVEHGQKLFLTNKATGDKLECKIVYLGRVQIGKTDVGIEFTQPAPEFWRIAFPPEDWKPLHD